MDFPATERAAINPRWFAVFCDPEATLPDAPLRNRVLSRLLRLLLKPGYRHCYAMRRMHTAQGWLVFNPHSACTDILELPGESFAEHVAAEAGAGRCTVIAADTQRPRAWVPRFSPTCAVAVAHLLGVPSRPWTTPYALYRHLKQEEPMGSVFSPPKADTSAADAAAKQAKQDADDLAAKNDARLRTLKAGSQGRSLLAYSGTGEAGVKTSLGAG